MAMNKQPKFSIQRRIFTTATLLLIIATVVLSLSAYKQAQNASDSAFDRLLAASALTIANAIQVDDQALRVELPLAALSMLPNNERIFYAVLNEHHFITGYNTLASHLPFAHSSEPIFSTIDFLDTKVRVATLGRFVTSSVQPSGWITIHVAETLDTRKNLSQQLFKQSLIPIGALILLALLMIFFSIRHAFKPLAPIEQALHKRTHTNLEPINVDTPTEVKSLVDGLNAFISRLNNALQRTEHLVAEAAHQIRTPLALLQAQVEELLEETPIYTQELKRIHYHTLDLSQLVNQILMQATITHRHDTSEHELIDIAQLIEATQRRLTTLEQQRLRIYITPPAKEIKLYGDVLALREMLRNIIHNALIYTTEQVEVWVYKDYNQNLCIDILDYGPGIPNNEIPKVLQRFYRGDKTKNIIGSGLGLTIAQQVVQHHQGELTVRNRKSGTGLAVKIKLPNQRKHTHSLTNN